MSTYSVRVSHRTTMASSPTPLGTIFVKVHFGGRCEASGELEAEAVRVAYDGAVPGRVASTFARIQCAGWVAAYLCDTKFSIFRDDNTGLEGEVKAE